MKDRVGVFGVCGEEVDRTLGGHGHKLDVAATSLSLHRVPLCLFGEVVQPTKGSGPVGLVPGHPRRQYGGERLSLEAVVLLAPDAL